MTATSLQERRVTVVVLTHNRRDTVLATLDRLRALPEAPPVIVVDNASTDGTAEAVARRHPGVTLLRLPHNRGAAGRNAGVERAATPYVACCDDDCHWEPGAMPRAADLLDRYPRLGAVAARLLVGDDGREDPTCAVMAHSPLPATSLPGPALIGFMAGAVVLRRRAFLEVGGYEPRLFLGGEERLIGLDLAARGWRMSYVADVVARHHPSALRDAPARRRLLVRNRIWIAWLRLPWRSAAWETLLALREAAAHGQLLRVAGEALAGLPWSLWRRRRLPGTVEAMRQQVLGRPWPWVRRPRLPRVQRG